MNTQDALQALETIEKSWREDRVRSDLLPAIQSLRQALAAAHRCIEDGSINEFYTRRDEYGFRQILAHSDQGWHTWYSDEWLYERHDIAL
jgi:hypothetical protein